jgi:hypothetical protein
MIRSGDSLADVSLALAWCIALTFGVAAIGKASSSGRTVSDLGVAFLELGLAAALVTHVAPQVTAFAVIGLTSTFAVRAALRPPGERCECFGSWLPSSGRPAQRIRNLSLLLIAFIYLGAVLASQGMPALPLVDLASGQILGIAVVLLPWLLEWTFPSDDRSQSPLVD